MERTDWKCNDLSFPDVETTTYAVSTFPLPITAANTVNLSAAYDMRIKSDDVNFSLRSAINYVDLNTSLLLVPSIVEH